MVCKKEISSYLRKQYNLKGEYIVLAGTVDHFLPVLRKNVKEAFNDLSYNFLARGKKVFVTVQKEDVDKAYDILCNMNPFSFTHSFTDLKGDKWLAKVSSKHCLYASEKEPFNAFLSHIYAKGFNTYFLFKRSHFPVKNLKKEVDE